MRHYIFEENKNTLLITITFMSCRKLVRTIQSIHKNRRDRGDVLNFNKQKIQNVCQIKISRISEFYFPLVVT